MNVIELLVAVPQDTDAAAERFATLADADIKAERIYIMIASGMTISLRESTYAQNINTQPLSTYVLSQDNQIVSLANVKIEHLHAHCVARSCKLQV